MAEPGKPKTLIRIDRAAAFRPYFPFGSRLKTPLPPRVPTV
jgi:hypothetical protein